MHERFVYSSQSSGRICASQNLGAASMGPGDDLVPIASMWGESSRYLLLGLLPIAVSLLQKLGYELAMLFDQMMLLSDVDMYMH